MLYKFFGFLLFIVPLFSCAVFGEQIGIQYAKLRNGLQVYVVQDHRIPAVLHSVIYKVGSMDDPIGKAGLAHFFEHLMFKTVGKFKDLKATMASVGARYNAYTTKTHTCYWELVLKQDLPLAMEIEADRMSNFDLGIESDAMGQSAYPVILDEKDVVLSERNIAISRSPLTLLSEEMDSAFYHTGYGRPIIGWETDIRSYNGRDVKNFHSSYYHPGNAMLLVVGDLQFDEVLKLAEEKYGYIQERPVEDAEHFYYSDGIRYSYAPYDSSDDTRRFIGVEHRGYQNQEPEHNTNLVLTLESDQAKVPVLVFRYRVPKFETVREHLMVDLVAYKLGGGRSSKLYKDLVLDKNIAVSVHAGYSGMTLSDGYIDIMVFPKDGISLELVAKELESSISRFIREGVTEEELQTAKYQYRVAQFDNLSSLENIAWFYTWYLALYVPMEDIDISYRQVTDINLDDVNGKIRTVFSATNKLVGRLLPKERISDESK